MMQRSSTTTRPSRPRPSRPFPCSVVAWPNAGEVTLPTVMPISPRQKRSRRMSRPKWPHYPLSRSALKSGRVGRRKSLERVLDQTDVMQHRCVRAGGIAGQDRAHDGVVFLVGAHEAALDLKLGAAKRADPAAQAHRV